MAPLVVPSPDVRYRIQNVDFRTFLDRRSLTNLSMRRMKDSFQQQVGSASRSDFNGDSKFTDTMNSGSSGKFLTTSSKS